MLRVNSQNKSIELEGEKKVEVFTVYLGKYITYKSYSSFIRIRLFYHTHTNFLITFGSI